MTFRKFGKTVLTAALSSAIVFSLSSCVRSFTVGFMFVTGTVTATPSGNGIISGFKIDNNTGKLTPLNGFPVGSGGANPVRAVLLSGGNFVYVLNRGANASGGSVCTAADPCLGANVTEFSVGGNGILTPENVVDLGPQVGFNPFRLVPDSTGSFLFVLEQNAPGSTNPNAPSSSTNPNQYCTTAGSTTGNCGDVAIYSINSTTGRLSLVVNAQLSTSSGNQVPYFPVPANPIDFTMASGYLMTLAGAPSASPSTVITNPALGQTVFPYLYNATNGQLSIVSSTPQQITNADGNPMGQSTAIVSAGGKVYILDNEPTPASSTPGQILTFTQSGTNGFLSSLVGGAVADDPTQTNPIYLILESKANFLFVANQAGANSTDAGGIVSYVIDPSSSVLKENPGGLTAYTGTGAIPTCLLEDPSNQYIYTANAGDSTVTGHKLDPNSGLLVQMSGSTGIFSLSGPATWCVVTGRT